MAFAHRERSSSKTKSSSSREQRAEREVAAKSRERRSSRENRERRSSSREQSHHLPLSFYSSIIWSSPTEYKRVHSPPCSPLLCTATTVQRSRRYSSERVCVRSLSTNYHIHSSYLRRAVCTPPPVKIFRPFKMGSVL